MSAGSRQFFISHSGHQQNVIDLLAKTKGIYADVFLTAQGREFKCHKFILAMHSEFLGNLLQNHLEPRISIAGFSAEVVSSTIQLIYTGEITTTIGESHEVILLLQALGVDWFQKGDEDADSIIDITTTTPRLSTHLKLSETTPKKVDEKAANGSPIGRSPLSRTYGTSPLLGRAADVQTVERRRSSQSDVRLDSSDEGSPELSNINNDDLRREPKTVRKMGPRSKCLKKTPAKPEEMFETENLFRLKTGRNRSVSVPKPVVMVPSSPEVTSSPVELSKKTRRKRVRVDSSSSESSTMQPKVTKTAEPPVVKKRVRVDSSSSESSTVQPKVTKTAEPPTVAPVVKTRALRGPLSVRKRAAALSPTHFSEDILRRLELIDPKLAGVPRVFLTHISEPKAGSVPPLAKSLSVLKDENSNSNAANHFYCPYCEVFLTNADSFTKHRLSRACLGSKFLEGVKLKKFPRELGGAGKAANTMFPCNYCRQTFSTKWNVRDHKLRDCRYLCEKCNNPVLNVRIKQHTVMCISRGQKSDQAETVQATEVASPSPKAVTLATPETIPSPATERSSVIKSNKPQSVVEVAEVAQNESEVRADSVQPCQSGASSEAPVGEERRWNKSEVRADSVQPESGASSEAPVGKKRHWKRDRLMGYSMVDGVCFCGSVGVNLLTSSVHKKCHLVYYTEVSKFRLKCNACLTDVRKGGKYDHFMHCPKKAIGVDDTSPRPLEVTTDDADGSPSVSLTPLSFLSVVVNENPEVPVTPLISGPQVSERVSPKIRIRHDLKDPPSDTNQSGTVKNSTGREVNLPSRVYPGNQKQEAVKALKHVAEESLKSKRPFFVKGPHPKGKYPVANSGPEQGSTTPEVFRKPSTPPKVSSTNSLNPHEGGSNLTGPQPSKSHNLSHLFKEGGKPLPSLDRPSLETPTGVVRPFQSIFDIPDIELECHICGLVFETQESVNGHVREAHDVAQAPSEAESLDDSVSVVERVASPVFIDASKQDEEYVSISDSSDTEDVQVV